MFCLNLPYPFAFNNCFSPLLSLYSLYNGDNDNNGSRAPTLNKTSKFSDGIHVEKHGN